MEKYYFIGRRNAVTAEIVKILQEKNIGYEFVEKGQYGIYDVSQKQVDACIAQGKKPYFVGIFSVRDGAVRISDYRFNCEPSALQVVANNCGVVLSAWQNLVLLNDENVYNRYPYDVCQMLELVRMGYSRQDIEKVRAYNRAESGVSAEEENAAEICVKNACREGALWIVRNLPHEKFETVTDRLFWLQRVQNVVIFTTTGRALYAGFADIALDLFKFFEGDLSYCFWRGCRKTEEEQDEVIKFLVEEIRKKDRNVLF